MPIGDVWVLREGSVTRGAGALPAKMGNIETAPRKGFPSWAGISASADAGRGGEPLADGRRCVRTVPW